MKSKLIQSNPIQSNFSFILIILFFSTFLLANACKEDFQQKSELLTKKNPTSGFTVYPCDGQGSETCEASQACCNYSATCCSSRQNLVRSNYSTGLDYAKALACELEKILQGCTAPQYEYGCIEDKYCVSMKGLTNGSINSYYGATTAAIDYCTFNTNKVLILVVAFNIMSIFLFQFKI